MNIIDEFKNLEVEEISDAAFKIDEKICYNINVNLNQ
jgi:hypothetical protein